MLIDVSCFYYVYIIMSTSPEKEINTLNNIILIKILYSSINTQSISIKYYNYDPCRRELINNLLLTDSSYRDMLNLRNTGVAIYHRAFMM